MKRILLFLMVCFVMTVARGQRTCVIADMETHTPLRGVMIHTNTEHWARTLYTGQFEMIYAFDSAEVTKPGYLSTYIYSANLPDTVYLLKKSLTLDEVSVYGKDYQKENLDNMAEKMSRIIKENTPSPGLVQFDFASMIDKRGRRDAKHLKKMNEIYDSWKPKPDPIMEAYNKTMAEKKEKEDELKKEKGEREKAKIQKTEEIQANDNKMAAKNTEVEAKEQKK